ncbi:hypothetical protein Bca52824_042443 [Brassica carinata]|uniref:Uncharacterized protein n=1 Tax=Brassica carinata TaxID=52824 RepID=A0A8X7RV96_BRACI|nr:hypothetical protein Bca52824_042443 [Brassica carinata]
METSAVLTCSSSMATSAKTACNVKKGGELMDGVMLLLDSKATLLAASSPSHHLQTSLDGSLEEHFRFRNHSQLLGLANTNAQLPDIIAETVTIAELNEFILIAQHVQRSFSGWSHPLLAQPSITPLHWCLSDGNDDHGDDMPGNISGPTKVDTDGDDCEEAPTIGTTSTGVDTNKPPATATSKVAKDGTHRIRQDH